MGKPTLLDTSLGKKFDIIKTSLINRLFEKLEEIRVYHLEGGQSGSGFSSPPKQFDTEIAQDGHIITDEPPKKIKEYITVLEQSKYIPDDIYSKQVPIPIKAETIITSMNNYLEEVRIINELAVIDANDASYCGTNKTNTSYSEGGSDSCSCDNDCYGDGWNQADTSCNLDSSYGSYNGESSNGCCGYS